MSESDEISTSARQTGERKKSNLAFAFFCLDKSRARDMEVFYAFCRLMDDIADEEGRAPAEKRRELEAWKAEIASLYGGSKELSPLAAEMADVVARRKIPQEYIQAIIDGVMRDTSGEPFETFEDIRKYCYGVASAVGLVTIYIFGFKNERTKLYAESLGYALQFTNILRDAAFDMRTQNRCYIPRRELEFFGVSEGDLAEPSRNPRCKELFRMMHFRAKHFFRKADRLLPPEDRAAMKPAFIMREIYENILDSIAASGFEISANPRKPGKFKKAALAVRALIRARGGSEGRNFGSVCVLGGGIAGICAALKLAREGFDPEIFEARASAGGRASAVEWRGARLDNGSHAAMGCCRNLFGFMEELGGPVSAAFSRADSMDFAFAGGEKIRVPFPPENAGIFKKILSIFAYRKIPGVGGARNLLLFAKLKLGFAGARDGETAREFLERHKIGKAAVEVFWEPFCVSALNTSCGSASAELMLSTLRKSVLAGGENGILYFPKAAAIDALMPKAAAYLECVGARIRLSEPVEKIEIRGGKFVSIETRKSGALKFDSCVSALPAKALAKMLPEASPFAARIGKIGTAGIINAYFTTGKKLFDGSYASLAGSPIHWIFDHTQKSRQCAESGTFLYGATISHARIPFDPAEIRRTLERETEKYFGAGKILDFLPSLFAEATISADCESESARPADGECGAQNLHICGDWVATGLPCTMESAAKSANDLNIFD